MQNLRKQEMLRINQVIQKEWAAMVFFNSPGIDEMVFSFLKKKVSKISVRSFFVVWIYRYIQELAQKEGQVLEKIDPILFEQKIPFCIEVVMSVMYLDNHALDEKHIAGIKNPIANKILGANLLKDCLYDYIDDHIDQKYSRRIGRYIREIFRAVDAGQYLEKEYLTYPNFQHGIEELPRLGKFQAPLHFGRAQDIIDAIKNDFPSHRNFLQLYFYRLFLSCASLFYFSTKMIINLLGFEGKYKTSILYFAGIHGMMRQLVNDIADMVPVHRGTVGKLPGDRLKDLKNGVMTLPITLHLLRHKKRNTVRLFLEKGNTDLLQSHLILDEMIQSKAIPYSMKIARNLISSQGSRPYLCGKLPAEQMLTDLNSIAFNNRFYHEIFVRRNHLKTKGCYKQPKPLEVII